MRRDKAVVSMTDCQRKGNWYSKPPLGYDKVKIDKDHILTVNETGKILRDAFIWKATEGIGDIEKVQRLKGWGYPKFFIIRFIVGIYNIVCWGMKL